MSGRDDTTGGKWLGRKPKGQQDTHSFLSFLDKRSACGCRGGLREHLRRHHRGYSR